MPRKKKKPIDRILDSLDWQEAWKEIPSAGPAQVRYEDDSPKGRLAVLFSGDMDAWVEILPDPDEMKSVLRFRVTEIGGGESARVRQALMILAMAIKADNEDRPQNRTTK